MTTLTTRKATAGVEWAETRLFCQRNLYRLAKDILGYTDMTDAFHKPMLIWSQTNPAKKKLHMAARGTYKSSGSIAKRIQYILNYPAHSTLLGSNKAENAQKFLLEIAGHLRTNEKLMWAFPEILWRTPRDQADHYLKGAITVQRPKGARPTRQGTIETNGVEGELVSNHYENGAFDDAVGFENSQTRPERMKVIDWYEACAALVDQPTPALATQDLYATPWDADDLYAHLLAKKEKGLIQLAVYAIPCWEPDPGAVGAHQARQALERAMTGQPDATRRRVLAQFSATFGEVPGRGPMRATFPEKLSVPVLIQMRKTMPLRFPAQYELTPLDQDTTVLHRRPPDATHAWGIPVIKPRRECPPIQQMWLAITIDPAISQKGWADYSALTVNGWDHENNQHVLWLRWGRWTETQLIEETYLAYNAFVAKGNAPSIVGIEAVAFQKLYRSLFVAYGEKHKNGHILPVHGLPRDTKHTKQTRQLVLEPGWNAGEIILYEDLDALDDLLDMASKFRAHKELTRDDLLDVLADNHQLRVRPRAVDPHPEITSLPAEEQPRVRYIVDVQARRAVQNQDPLDHASLHMAWLHHKRKTDAAQTQYADSLGLVEESILWG